MRGPATICRSSEVIALLVRNREMFGGENGAGLIAALIAKTDVCGKGAADGSSILEWALFAAPSKHCDPMATTS